MAMLHLSGSGFRGSISKDALAQAYTYAQNAFLLQEANFTAQAA